MPFSSEIPLYPAGPPQSIPPYSEGVKESLIRELQQAPGLLQQEVESLTESQLDTPYRNWTIRQIVHHLADSHVHSYLRFKWAVTEDCPTIKPYQEAVWVELADARTGDIAPALQLMSAIHAKWVSFLQTLTEADFSRTFFHPESNETISLWTALQYYPWHCRHHTAQIHWLHQRFEEPEIGF